MQVRIEGAALRDVATDMIIVGTSHASRTTFRWHSSILNRDGKGRFPTREAALRQAAKHLGLAIVEPVTAGVD